MKVLCAAAAAGLSLMTCIGSVSAHDDDDYGYRGSRDRDYGYHDRGYRDRGYYRSRDRDYDSHDDDNRGRGRAYGFDEQEYLHCNPDVRRAIERGQMSSAADHYRVFGRREGRRLSC